MNDPFRPTADTRPMPRPWGDTALIVVVSVLIGLTIGNIGAAVMSDRIAAEIDAQKFIGGKP